MCYASRVMDFTHSEEVQELVQSPASESLQGTPVLCEEGGEPDWSRKSRRFRVEFIKENLSRETD